MRAAIVAAAAADAHVLFPLTGLVVVDLVQGAITQALAMFGTKTVATGHVAEAIHHAAGPLATAFTLLGVLRIGEVVHAVAAAGRAGGGAAATADAAAVVLGPDRMGGKDLADPLGVVTDAVRGAHLDRVALDKLRGEVVGLAQFGKVAEQLGILDLDTGSLIAQTNGGGVVLGLIAAHGDAEAVLEALAALQQHQLELAAQPGVVDIAVLTVFQIDLIQPAQGVDITAAQEQQGGLGLHPGFAQLQIVEVEQGLGDGEYHLFRGEVGLLLPHQIGRMADAVVGDVVGVGEATAPIFGRRGHDPVIG